MQVILQEDIAALGKAGEVVTVKPGFARNYILPRGLGVVATEGNIQQIEHVRKAAIANAAKLKKSFDAIAQQLSASRRALDKAYHTMVGCLIESQLTGKGVVPADAKPVVDMLSRYS